MIGLYTNYEGVWGPCVKCKRAPNKSGSTKAWCATWLRKVWSGSTKAWCATWLRKVWRKKLAKKKTRNLWQKKMHKLWQKKSWRKLTWDLTHKNQDSSRLVREC